MNKIQMQFILVVYCFIVQKFTEELSELSDSSMHESETNILYDNDTTELSEEEFNNESVINEHYFDNHYRRFEPEANNALIRDENANDDAGSRLVDGTRSNWSNWMIILVTVSMLICMIPFSNDFSGRNEIGNINDEFDRYSHYRIQNEDVKSYIISGLKLYLSGSSPITVYMLLYNGPTEKPDADCLARVLVRTINRQAFQYKRSNSFVHIKGDEFTSYVGTNNEYGTFLDLITPAVAAEHVLLLTDLHLIPAHLSMAFHFLCDNYNPAVGNVFYVFTVDAKSSWLNDRLKSDLVGQQTLRTAWKNLNEDNFHSLMARLLSYTLLVTGMQNKTCPLDEFPAVVKLEPTML